MSYIHSQRKRSQETTDAVSGHTIGSGPSMEALIAGTANPTAAQKGRPFDLDAAMKAKMENAFGDLSAVRFYESPAVGEAGAEAIAQGNEIAFAPGMANFSTRSGQERLGHELSHVMSQQRGEVRGSGFLTDAALEARADREGAMAAAAGPYDGPVTHALSAASPVPSAAGPMQASRGRGRSQGGGQNWNQGFAPSSSDFTGSIMDNIPQNTTYGDDDDQIDPFHPPLDREDAYRSGPASNDMFSAGTPNPLGSGSSAGESALLDPDVLYRPPDGGKKKPWWKFW